MGKTFTQNQPVDNSALIHLAVHNTWHSNCLRLVAHLKGTIRPVKLQRAVDVVAPQFPMLAAGIRPKGKTFVVVPQAEQLYIRWDHETLAYMSMEEIRNCALRVLYGAHRIAIEVFHALTDGAGGLQFLKALLAEYLDAPAKAVPGEKAWEDSFYTYANGSLASIPGGSSYLLPAASELARSIHQTTLTFSVKELLAVTRAEHTTITAFFTALFVQTAMKQQQYEKETSGETLLPVQVMVPIDLRKRFESTSLRNFSLYALPKLTPRVHSHYNCGIVSMGDILSLTITRRGEDKGVERVFVSLLIKLGIVPAVVEDELQNITAASVSGFYRMPGICYDSGMKNRPIRQETEL